MQTERVGHNSWAVLKWKGEMWTTPLLSGSLYKHARDSHRTQNVRYTLQPVLNALYQDGKRETESCTNKHFSTTMRSSFKKRKKEKKAESLFHNSNMETLLSESRPLFKIVFTTHFWFYSKVASSKYKHFKIKLLFKHHLTSDHTFQCNNIKTIVSKKKCNPILFDNQTFKTFTKTELWWGRKGWGGNNKQNIAELRTIQLIIY